jgi:hypothetical protein
MSNGLTAADINLTVDEELHRGIPKHTDAEAKAFRESVDREGRYRDPIRYWQQNGTALVLDGRHRLEDWQARPKDLPAPSVEEVLLPDKAAARLYIVREQLARRNLTPQAFKTLVGELYNQQKKARGGDRKSAPDQSADSALCSKAPENTAETVAEEVGVSPRTVKVYGKLVEAKNAINQTLPPLLVDLESYKVPGSAVLQIAKLTKPQMVEVRKNLKAGRKWNAGIGSQANGSKPKRKKNGAEVSTSKAVDALLKTHVSPLARGIDSVAEMLGWERGKARNGNHKAADDALNSFIESVKQMREGKL